MGQQIKLQDSERETNHIHLSTARELVYNNNKQKGSQNDVSLLQKKKRE